MAKTGFYTKYGDIQHDIPEVLKKAKESTNALYSNTFMTAEIIDFDYYLILVANGKSKDIEVIWNRRPADVQMKYFEFSVEALYDPTIQTIRIKFTHVVLTPRIDKTPV